jgi:hypothetical protein
MIPPTFGHAGRNDNLCKTFNALGVGVPLGAVGTSGWKKMEAIQQLGTVGNETLYTVNVMFFFWGVQNFVRNILGYHRDNMNRTTGSSFCGSGSSAASSVYRMNCRKKKVGNPY